MNRHTRAAEIFSVCVLCSYFNQVQLRPTSDLEYIMYSYLRVNAKLYRACERCSCRSFICVQIFIRVTSCYTQYVLLSKIRASIFILMHIVIAFCDFIFTLCTICYALNSTHQFWFHSFMHGEREWLSSLMILNSLLIPLISK